MQVLFSPFGNTWILRSGDVLGGYDNGLGQRRVTGRVADFQNSHDV